MNKEQKKEYMLAWRLRNKTRLQEYDRQYHLNNKTHRNKLALVRALKWSKDNRDKKNKWNRDKRKTLISKYKMMLGNKCVNCNSTSLLEFDHIDPKTKKFDITTYISCSENKLFEELKKCQLLCLKCHIDKSVKDGIQNTTIQLMKSKLSAFRTASPMFL